MKSTTSNSGKSSQSNSQGNTKQKSGGGKSNPGFLFKAYAILEDPELQHLAGWGDDGKRVVVKDIYAFSNLVLPRFFKHSNFASFVRQLNMYGFKKVKMQNNSQEFLHPMFYRGGKDVLGNIQRKTHAKQMLVDRKRDKMEVPLEIQKSVELLKSKHRQYETQLLELQSQNGHLQAENAELWQQMQFAQKKQKQLELTVRKVGSVVVHLLKNDPEALLSLRNTKEPLLLMNSGNPDQQSNSEGGASDTPTRTAKSVRALKNVLSTLRHAGVDVDKIAQSNGVPSAGPSPVIGPLGPADDLVPTPTEVGLAMGLSPPSRDVVDKQPAGASDTLLRLPSSIEDNRMFGSPAAPLTQSKLPNNTAEPNVLQTPVGVPAAGLTRQESTGTTISGLFSYPGFDDADNGAQQASSTNPEVEGSGAWAATDASPLQRAHSLSLGESDLGPADSLAATPSLIEFVERMNKNDKLQSDPSTKQKYTAFANNLDQLLDEQDNTLRRMNTVESLVSAVGSEPTPITFDDDDDVDQIKREDTGKSNATDRDTLTDNQPMQKKLKLEGN